MHLLVNQSDNRGDIRGKVTRSEVIEDGVFKSDGLSIFTVRHDQTFNAIDFRRYIKKNWKTIFQGLTNSTILIIGGVYGSVTGEVGGRNDSMKSIKNQVGTAREFCMIISL